MTAVEHELLGPQPVIFVSLFGGRGCLTQLLNLAAALAAPRRILSELVENEGLSAGRQLVTSRCLKGGSQSAFSGFC